MSYITAHNAIIDCRTNFNAKWPTKKLLMSIDELHFPYAWVWMLNNIPILPSSIATLKNMVLSQLLQYFNLYHFELPTKWKGQSCKYHVRNNKNQSISNDGLRLTCNVVVFNKIQNLFISTSTLNDSYRKRFPMTIDFLQYQSSAFPENYFSFEWIGSHTSFSI